MHNDMDSGLRQYKQVCNVIVARETKVSENKIQIA